ncbi:ketopantoate reductase family protein [Paenibacillus gansuensis]|uniref:Ketopantoate reductase family protein n=1 Tax=Paenibacillus gansuensis TaxID=306542 RepID=A0ABW5P8R5_9BACL
MIAIHQFTYGKFRNFTEQHYEAIRTALSVVPLFVEKSDIERDLWQKYALINVLSGLTSLFQASVGDIRDSSQGMDTFKQAFQETSEVIRLAGGKLNEGFIEKQLLMIEKWPREATSSTFRDLSLGLPTEFEHIQGYGGASASVRMQRSPSRDHPREVGDL